MDGQGRPGGAVFIAQVVFQAYGLAGVVPDGRQQFGIVEPHARAFMVPGAGRGCLVFLRPAVVLEFYQCAGLLLHGRVDIGPGIGGGVHFRGGIEGGHHRAPYMSQVDGAAGGKTGAVGLSSVGILVLRSLRLGREDGRRRTAVGKGVGDAPVEVGLTDIRHGLILQRVVFVEEEAALPVGKGLILTAAAGQRGTALLYIGAAAALPGALGGGQHVGVEVVLPQDVVLCGGLAVVPVGRHGAGHVGTALLHPVDAALVDTDHIGEEVEVVGVVVAAVDERDALHVLGP